MTTTEIMVAVITTTALLMLNWRALQSHGLPRQRLLMLGLIWFGIIAGVALIAGFFTD